MKKTTVRKNGQLFEKMDILRHFFEAPEREFHLREIARVTGLAASTVSKEMPELTEKGIIVSTKIRGFRLFKANTESALYKDLKLFYNIYQIRGSGIIEFLSDKLNYPKSIILFGSFRKSQNIPGSDIDLFAEISAKKEINLLKFEKKLRHPIQLFQFLRKDIDEMKSKNKELLNNIANGIVLEGFFEVF